MAQSRATSTISGRNRSHLTINPIGLTLRVNNLSSSKGVPASVSPSPGVYPPKSPRESRSIIRSRDYYYTTDEDSDSSESDLYPSHQSRRALSFIKIIPVRIQAQRIARIINDDNGNSQEFEESEDSKDEDTRKDNEEYSIEDDSTSDEESHTSNDLPYDTRDTNDINTTSSSPMIISLTRFLFSLQLNYHRLHLLSNFKSLVFHHVIDKDLLFLSDFGYLFKSHFILSIEIWKKRKAISCQIYSRMVENICFTWIHGD
jgi:hypothetical protein